MSRRPKGIALEIPAEEAASYRVDTDGAFVKGELSITNQGMRVAPKHRPSVTRETEPADDPQAKTADVLHSGERTTMHLSDLIFGTKLGEGASSQVFEARHRTTGQQYAVKQISIGDKGKRHQILQELTTLSQTSCPSIIQFHAAFFTDGVISIVLELMDCGSIDQLLQQSGPIPEPELAYFARQMIEGMVYMRSKHQVHRDIKPQNICLSRSGNCKLSDFGITSQLDSLHEEACDTFVGTSNYMSPERIMASKYSYSSDIWSIGLVLLECAMGRYPYPASGVYLEMMSSIVTGPAPVVPKELNFSPEFADFVAQCLVKDADKRATAEQLAQHAWFKLPVASARTQQQMQQWLAECSAKQAGSLDATAQTQSYSDAANDIEKAFGDLTTGANTKT